jgi:hypothetical protein
MARKSSEELSRFTMSNIRLRDSKGNIDPTSLKDWEKHVAQVTKALESATNGIVHVTNKIDEMGQAWATFTVPRRMEGVATPAFNSILGKIETQYEYLSGSLLKDPYQFMPKVEKYRNIVFHKDMHGSLSKSMAKDVMSSDAIGGEAVLDPTKQHLDRMKFSFPVSEQDWADELKKTKGDELKARTNLSKRFVTQNLKEAVKQSNISGEIQKDKEEEKKRRDEEKEDNINKRQSLRYFALIITTLTAIADITRRILTATIARGYEIRKDSVDAKSVGVTYGQAREYSTQERVMGLDKGTFLKALQSIESAVGDITNLDSNAVKELAKVLNSDTVQLIYGGLGKSDPERLMQLILNEYFKRGQKGINSAGINVGRYSAERELATALEKAGMAELAEILRNMFYANDSGLYKGRIGMGNPAKDYMALATAYTDGLTPAQYRKASELGETLSQLSEKFNLLKQNLETGLLIALEGIINRINNWDIGKSEKEKINDIRTNRALNKKAKADMEDLAELSTEQAKQLITEAGLNPEELNSKKPSKAFQDFLRTDKGRKVALLWRTAEVATDKAKLAQKNLDKEWTDGKIPFQASDFTTAGVQVSVGKDYANWYQIKSGEFMNYDELGSAYAKKHGVFSFDNALKGKVFPTALVNETYEVLKAKFNKEHGDAGEAVFKNFATAKDGRQLTKLEAIQKALDWHNAKLSDSEIFEIAVKGAMNGDAESWGLSGAGAVSMHKYIQEERRDEAENFALGQILLQTASQSSAWTDVLADKLVKSFKATSFEYDPKTGRTKFILDVNLKNDGKEQRTITFDAETSATDTVTTGSLDFVVNNSRISESNMGG